MNEPSALPFEAECRDPVQCRKIYWRIMQRCIKAAPGRHAEFEAALQALLASTPVPDRALVQLDRFLEASFSPSSMLDDFILHPPLFEALLRLTCASVFLADVLVRDSELFRWLILSGVLAEDKPREYFLETASDTAGRFALPERRVASLRRFHRRELLRIAARDLLHAPALVVTVAELSWLADSVIRMLLEESRHIVSARFGVDPPVRIAVLGLGKLGGEELNYSSDVDLMVVYDENRPILPSMDTHEFVVRVIEIMTDFLSKQTADGFFYRTDFRLRPDGNAGPIALSLPATLAYYESRGALWERQMLLKARVIAGDDAFGAQVLERLRPFSFPRTLVIPPSELLRDIQSRVSVRWREKSDLKHGRGGIRQVEFCAQALQLLNGGDRHELRGANTRSALRALAEANIMTGDEFTRLDTAYVFLRRVEHAVQLEGFEQTHEIPADEERRRLIAWTLGMESVDHFELELARVRDAVATTWDAVFTPAGAPAGTESRHLDEHALSALGFSSPRAAGKTVQALAEGRSARPHSASFRVRVGDVLPGLLADIGAGPSPDRTLKTVETGFDRMRSPEALLDYFSVPGSRRFLLRLAAGMPGTYLAACGNPLVFDLIFSGMTDRSEEQLTPALFKLLHETDAGGLYLLGRSSVEEYASNLSAVADRIVTRAYGDVSRQAGDPPFVVVALGKYGGGELSPGSDLDLVFVFEETAEWTNPQAQDLALRFIEAMHGSIESEKLYAIDARLRPEGRNSPLATSIGAYRKYLDRRASLWEKQSLLKARVVCGNSSMTEQFQRLAEETVASTGLTAADLGEIKAMRKRMEPENRFRVQDFFDVKLSAGGLVDAEFAAQAFQLHAAVERPKLLCANTFSALDGIARELRDAASWTNPLREQYTYLRRLQVAMRTMLDSPSNLLPTDASAIGALASAAGHHSAPDFLADLAKRRKIMRTAFDAAMDYLAERIPGST